MKIWYDVSDLVAWNLPHLTGIQRTTIGILNGLCEQVGDVGLVRYDAKARTFFAMKASDLPATVRCHLRGLATGESAAAAPGGPQSPPAAKPASRPARRRLKLFKKGFLFGGAGESEELRQAFRQFKTAARQLRKSFGHWAGRRLQMVARRGNPSGPPPHMRAGAAHARPVVATFADPGDVFVSLGASWVMPGHSEAVTCLRSRGVKVLRMIYDLIPTLKPQWLVSSDTQMITHWARSVLCESDCVLTISEFSRREIERYCEECRFAAAPIAVVRLGDVMGDAESGAASPPLPRFVPTRPFFVCVSTLDVRKNHRLLYDAWTLLAARRGEDCPDLVCIGTPHLYVADLLREMRQDRTVNRRIHVLHGIEDCELDWYYKHCQSTIYPSKYEGWGLPVAESLGHGRMCLASNATSIPEISSDLPEFFDPYDVHGLVALVERVLDDPAWVRSREETIRETFRPTEWHETAAQVLTAIAGSAGQSRRSEWPRLSQGSATSEPTVSPIGRTLKAA